MTSAHFSRTATAAAMALVGVLALGACSSDDGSDSDDSTPSASTSSSASASGSASASSDLAGSWLATTDGKAVVLIVTGADAAVFTTGGTTCSGTAGEESGMEMIRLKCTDGTEERTTGMVDSVDDTTLKVTWEGDLGQETYTKAEGGQLPSGLPTASSGS